MTRWLLAASGAALLLGAGLAAQAQRAANPSAETNLKNLEEAVHDFDRKTLTENGAQGRLNNLLKERWKLSDKKPLPEDLARRLKQICPTCSTEDSTGDPPVNPPIPIGVAPSSTPGSPTPSPRITGRPAPIE